MKVKTQRLNVIRELVANHKVGNQEELLALLERQGFSTTQATLSRDLKALKVAKQPGLEGDYVYMLPEETEKEEPRGVVDAFPASAIDSIEFSGPMAVIRTRPGFANSIASIIDSQEPYEVLGTIAGDDTILLISREGVSRPDVIIALSLFMPGLKNKLV
jgi:transcriptional regulator of arginine metabolism